MLRSIFVGSFSFYLLLGIAGNSSAGDRNKGKPPEPTPAELEAREHVQQALLAESLGDNALRARHLSTASLAQPGLPAANWHLARVQVAGTWLPLAEAELLAANNADFRKHREQRDAAKNPKMLQSLARWCAKNGWEEESQLHYAQVLTHSDSTPPMREEAIQRLDLQRLGDTWATGDQIAAYKSAAAAIEGAIRQWHPQVKQLQVKIDGIDFAARDRALAEFQAIDDPAIIPNLELFLAAADSPFHEAVVARLAGFRQIEATDLLVKYAVLSPHSLARSDAMDALQGRPMHEYVPLLLQGLEAPLKSQFQVSWDAGGRIHYQHAFLREGASGNLLLVAQRLALPLSTNYMSSKDDRVLVRCGTPASSTSATYAGGTTPAEAFRDKLDLTRSEAVKREAGVTLANSAINQSNQRLFEVLERSTGQRLAREPVSWWTWWTAYNEYAWPRPTLLLYESLASNYYAHQYRHTHLSGTRASCFLAGTPVRTQNGLAAIESVKPGDRVLAQDQDSGELTYKLVLRTTLRPPADMIKVKAGTEEIVTTLGHPFWVNGHGWRMAKQLNEGDLLHSTGGAIRIDAVEPMPKQPAHNLVVADFNTYFVGNQGLLVHDNEYRRPTRSIVPGLVAAAP
jgi:hypothetical protein